MCVICSVKKKNHICGIFADADIGDRLISADKIDKTLFRSASINQYTLNVLNCNYIIIFFCDLLHSKYIVFKMTIYFKLNKSQLHHNKCVITNIFQIRAVSLRR